MRHAGGNAAQRQRVGDRGRGRPSYPVVSAVNLSSRPRAGRARVYMCKEGIFKREFV